MKAIRIVIPILALVFIMSGCVAVNIQGGGNTVIGKGDVVSRSYEVESFDSVEIRGGEYEIIYREADSCAAKLEMQENLFEYVSVSAEGGKLLVNSRNTLRSQNGESLKLYISAPGFKNLAIHGYAVMKDSDIIKTDNFSVNISGACSMDVALEVKDLKLVVDGAGDINLSGSADSARIDLSGAASIDALELDTVTADVDMSGAGAASIGCSDKLNIEISGMGSFEYRGNPEITKRISGLGTVKKVD